MLRAYFLMVAHTKNIDQYCSVKADLHFTSSCRRRTRWPSAYSLQHQSMCTNRARWSPTETTGIRGPPLLVNFSLLQNRLFMKIFNLLGREIGTSAVTRTCADSNQGKHRRTNSKGMFFCPCQAAHYLSILLSLITDLQMNKLHLFLPCQCLHHVPFDMFIQIKCFYVCLRGDVPACTHYAIILYCSMPLQSYCHIVICSALLLGFFVSQYCILQ